MEGNATVNIITIMDSWKSDIEPQPRNTVVQLLSKQNTSITVLLCDKKHVEGMIRYHLFGKWFSIQISTFFRLKP